MFGLYVGDDCSRNRVRDAKVAAEILQEVAHRIEKGDHLRPCHHYAVHVFPFTDHAEGAVAGLDQRALLEAGDVKADLVVGIDECLFLARLGAEPDDVVSSHVFLPSSGSRPPYGRAPGNHVERHLGGTAKPPPD